MSWANRSKAWWARPRNTPGYDPKTSRFRVKRPITSFRDLEVYQRTQETARLVVQEVVPLLAGKNFPNQDRFLEQALAIPERIAEAHSRRFDDEERALDLLTQAYEACNTMVVRLEQVRDIYAGEIGRDACENVLGKYLAVRVKIRNLGRAWRSWMLEKKSQKPTTAVSASQAPARPFAVTDQTHPGASPPPRPQRPRIVQPAPSVHPATSTPAGGVAGRDREPCARKGEPPI